MLKKIHFIAGFLATLTISSFFCLLLLPSYWAHTK